MKNSQRIAKFLAGCSLAVLLTSCGSFPDPNDIAAISEPERPEAAHRILESVSTLLDVKVRAAEITDEERFAKLREVSEELLKSIDGPSVLPASAWKYADLLRVSERWEEAEKALTVAVKNARDTDRLVNDSLRLAQAQAKLNKVDEAIKTARSIYNVPDDQCAPILPATLYEIVPAAEGKGKDSELATLLMEAIQCHARTVVDMKTDSGRIFSVARRYHIRKAEAKIEVLRNVKSL